jgi:hypothetical protein
MKAKILILIGILLALPLISAVDDDLFFEPNQTIELNVFCFDANSSLCNSSTQCEVTIFYPNSTIYDNNRSMTFNDNYFNYSANSSAILGVYSYMVHCHVADSEGYQTADFYVGRPSTAIQEATTTRAIYVLVVIAALLFVGFVFVKKAPFKWSFFLISLLFLTMAINTASISLRNEAGSENIRQIFDQIGAGCYVMYYFIGGLMAMIWTLTLLGSLANKKNMRIAREIGRPINMEKL